MLTNRTVRCGFGLIEILMVLAILSILTALTFPLYCQYTMGVRRLEAEEMLSKLAIAMEEFHIEHNTYQNATLNDLKFSEWVAQNHYRLAIEETAPDDYWLNAIPVGKQAEQDSLCGQLSLSASGEKHISGSGSVMACW